MQIRQVLPWLAFALLIWACDDPQETEEPDAGHVIDCHDHMGITVEGVVDVIDATDVPVDANLFVFFYTGDSARLGYGECRLEISEPVFPVHFTINRHPTDAPIHSLIALLDVDNVWPPAPEPGDYYAAVHAPAVDFSQDVSDVVLTLEPFAPSMTSDCGNSDGVTLGGEVRYMGPPLPEQALLWLYFMHQDLGYYCYMNPSMDDGFPVTFEFTGVLSTPYQYFGAILDMEGAFPPSIDPGDAYGAVHFLGPEAVDITSDAHGLVMSLTVGGNEIPLQTCSAPGGSFLRGIVYYDGDVPDTATLTAYLARPGEPPACSLELNADWLLDGPMAFEMNEVPDDPELGVVVILDMDGDDPIQAGPGDYQANMLPEELDLPRDVWYMPLILEPVE